MLVSVHRKWLKSREISVDYANSTAKQESDKNILRNLILSPDSESYVFESKEEALKMVKANKESRFKSFKNRDEALKFVKNGIQQANSGSNINKPEFSPSSLEALLKCKDISKIRVMWSILRLFERVCESEKKDIVRYETKRKIRMTF